MRLFLSIAILFFFFATLGSASPYDEQNEQYFSEVCFVDNNYVLLYKIINWWYDCLPADDTLPCGDFITCQTIGKLIVYYNKEDKTLTLENTGDFAGLLSVLRQCSDCPGPSHFECTWLNGKYFNTIPTEAVPHNTNIKVVQIAAISQKQADRIRSMADDMVFVVEGRVGGLLLGDGKIALHGSGKFLKPCPKAVSGENTTITLLIKNSKTEETIARYTAVFDE